MKIWIVKETWELDNAGTDNSEKLYLFLNRENALKKFFEVRKEIIEEFTEWYGEKDNKEYDEDNNWHIKNWNITCDSDLEFTCSNSDWENEKVVMFSQDTID